MQDSRTFTDTDPRALFGARRAEVSDTHFTKEEALMRAGELTLSDSTFSAPRPLAHVTDALIRTCHFEKDAVSLLSHAGTATLQGCTVEAPHGCEMAKDLTIDTCQITACDFGTSTSNLTLTDTLIAGARALAHTRDVTMTDMDITSDRALSYAMGGTIDFSTLAGEELLFGAENLTISDTVLDGDRIGWYSNHLTLTHCVISGDRPFAYAKNLTLIDCALDPSCREAFERSEVEATLRGALSSVRNPLHGSITADALGEVIFDDTAAPGTDCKITAKA